MQCSSLPLENLRMALRIGRLAAAAELEVGRASPQFPVSVVFKVDGKHKVDGICFPMSQSGHGQSTVTPTRFLFRPASVALRRHGHSAQHRQCIRAKASSIAAAKHFQAVALDVEYIHFFCSGAAFVLPGEVCVVDAQGRELFHSYCSPGDNLCMPGLLATAMVAYRGTTTRQSYISLLCIFILICRAGRAGAARYWCGGVRPRKWLCSPPLPIVAPGVAAAIEGRLLVGHGLQKDLASLGLAHPPRLIRDTMTYAPFQARGHARRLKALAAELLGSTIQAGRHSAKWVPVFLAKDCSAPRHSVGYRLMGVHNLCREDAVAAMQLYLAHIAEVEQDADVLVQYYLSQMAPGRARDDFLL